MKIRLFLLINSLISLSFAQTPLDSLILKAYSSHDSYNFKQSLQYFDSAGNMAIKEGDLTNLIKIIVGKGLNHRYDYQNENIGSAYQYFYLANVLARLQDSPEVDLSEIYYSLATTERRRLDYVSALNYADSAFDAQADNDDLHFKAKWHNMLANILQDQEAYDSASLHYRLAIETRQNMERDDDYILAMYHSNYAQSLKNAGRFKESLESTLEALALNLSFSQMDSIEISIINRLLGIGYGKLKNISSARYHFTQSQLFGDRTNIKESLSRMRDIADFHRSVGNLDSAHIYYDYAFQKVIPIPGLSNDEIIQKLVSDSLEHLIEETSHVLFRKATLYYDQYVDSQDLTYLNDSRDVYLLIDDIMYKRRYYSTGVNPSLHLATHFKEIYEGGLKTLYTIYSQNPDISTVSDAFRFIERNKHMILLKKRANLEVQGREISVLSDINMLHGALSNEKEGGANNLFQMIKEIEDEIDNNYNYQNSDSRLNVIESIELADMKEQLAPGELLLSYLWGEQDLYVVSLSENSIFFNRVDLHDLESTIRDFLKVSKSTDINKLESDFITFRNTSNILYDKLVGPSIKYSAQFGEDISYLNIIPDGILNFIPYSILTDATTSSEVDYRDLPYLIKKYYVSYAFSGSIHAMHNGDKIQQTTIQGYANTILQGATVELKTIGKVWKDRIEIFADTDNTESNFKRNAPSSELLHIASHASSGNNNELPNIIFQNSTESNEDGRLFPHEIYALDLQAELAVLSACETGLGKDYDGEGIFSLARSFVYAGCNSVLISLWKLKDIKTVSLMSDFYKSLDLGLDLTESLRAAQLNYLEKSDELSSHPSNWSAFIIIGNGRLSIVKQHNYFLYIVGFTGITILLYLLVHWYKKASVTPPHRDQQVSIDH